MGEAGEETVMHKIILHKACAGASCLRLTGAFAFIFILILSATNLTTVTFDDMQLPFIYSQMLMTAFGVLFTIGLLMILSRRFSGARMDAVLTVMTMLMMLIALLLIVLMKATFLSTVVLLLFAAVCALQLYLGARDCSQISIPSMTLWVSIVLAFATMVSAVATLCLKTANYSFLFVGLVMLICSIRPSDLWQRDSGRSSVSRSNVGMLSKTETTPPQGRLSDLIYDWQPLLGGFICAVGFGLDWNWPYLVFQFPDTLFPFVGRLIACVGLIIIFVVVDKRLASDLFNYLLALAAIIGVFVWSSGNEDYASTVLFLFANISQTLFFGLLWIQTLFTGRENRDPTLLPCMGVFFFLVAFILGALASQVISFSVTTRLVPLALLIYLYVMFISVLRKSQMPQHEALKIIDLNTLFEDACVRIEIAYGLSRRESEILPFLIWGLSSTTIGDRLFISPQTVKTHAHRIYTKMSIHSHDQLADVFSRFSK